MWDVVLAVWRNLRVTSTEIKYSQFFLASTLDSVFSCSIAQFAVRTAPSGSSSFDALILYLSTALTIFL